MFDYDSFLMWRRSHVHRNLCSRSKKKKKKTCVSLIASIFSLSASMSACLSCIAKQCHALDDRSEKSFALLVAGVPCLMFTMWLCICIWIARVMYYNQPSNHILESATRRQRDRATHRTFDRVYNNFSLALSSTLHSSVRRWTYDIITIEAIFFRLESDEWRNRSCVCVRFIECRMRWITSARYVCMCVWNLRFE